MKEFEHMTQAELREELERLRIANAQFVVDMERLKSAMRAVAKHLRGRLSRSTGRAGLALRLETAVAAVEHR